MATQTISQVKTENEFDVIIVGAGIAGLVCADVLLKERPSLRLLILETNSRCGGRTKSIKLDSREDGLMVDKGGMWLGNQHKIMLGLCDRFGIRLVEQHSIGSDVLITSSGARHVSSDNHDYPTMSIFTRLDLYFNIIRELYRLEREIPVDTPWMYSRAKELDSFSMDAYFRQRCWTSGAIDFLNVVVKAIMGCEASQVSCLFGVWGFLASGGLDYVLDTKDGAQEWRMRGGAQQISERLREAIEERPNARVFFEKHVTHITEVDSGHIEVKCRNSLEVFRCTQLVSAANASVLIREVQFSPRLPPVKEHFAQRTFRGSYGKALIVFTSAFWRAKGLSGGIMNQKEDAFVSSALDYCIDDENFYAIVCFFAGDAGIKAAQLNEEERREGVLSDLAKCFLMEVDELRRACVEYKEYMWHQDPVAQGCSGVIYGPGHFCPFVAARVFPISSEDKIHFIGTDVSMVFPGYMEGAAHTGLAMGNHLSKLFAP